MKSFLKENERVDDLQFQGLKIIQHPKGYCFTSDSVLLSSFAKIKKDETAYDFCSGSGVIAVLLAAKNISAKKIYGVELQQRLAEMAVRSIALNNLQEKIEILNCSIQELYNCTESGSADVVVCNPPYSKFCKRNEPKKNPATTPKGLSFDNNIEADLNNIDNGIRSVEADINMQNSLENKLGLKNLEIDRAKYEISVTIEEIIIAAKKLLRFKGRFYLIHQAERAAEIISLMVKHNIEPKVIQCVQAKPGKQPHLILVEGVKGGNSGLKWLENLIIYDQENRYTEQAKIIYNIFD